MMYCGLGVFIHFIGERQSSGNLQVRAEGRGQKRQGRGLFVGDQNLMPQVTRARLVLIEETLGLSWRVLWYAKVVPRRPSFGFSNLYYFRVL